MKTWPILIVFAFATLLDLRVLGAETLSDSTLASLTFDQKLNAQVPSNLRFRDETGKPVRLEEFLSQKPIILVMGYYQCPMLCTLVLNGMVESLEDLKWTIGKEFDVINVSINPAETAALAAAKKRSYLKRYGRAGAAQGWHFLTGDSGAIQQLASAVGFHYAYDEASRQYAHPSGLVILTPQGKVAGYLFGVTYRPKDLFQALEQASQSRVSSPIRNLILLCFHYNPITGRYGPTIMLTVRILAVATVLGLAGLLASAARKPRPATAVIPGSDGDLPLSQTTSVNSAQQPTQPL
jgi:protein SCO1